jgi:hypothetical protein
MDELAASVRSLIVELEARARFATSRADRTGRVQALPYLAGVDRGVALACREAADTMARLLAEYGATTLVIRPLTTAVGPASDGNGCSRPQGPNADVAGQNQKESHHA